MRRWTLVTCAVHSFDQCFGVLVQGTDIGRQDLGVRMAKQMRKCDPPRVANVGSACESRPEIIDTPVR